MKGIQSFLLLFCGLLAGPLFDVGYFRVLLVSGNVLVVLGMMLTRSFLPAMQSRDVNADRYIAFAKSIGRSSLPKVSS